MLTLVADREEFAAERTNRQERAIDGLRPKVEKSLSSGEWTAVTAGAVQLFTAAAHSVDEDLVVDEDDPLLQDMLAGLVNSLRRTGRTEPDSRQREIQEDAISQWVAVMAINAGTEAAAARNRENVVLEWVSMEDASVRHTHQVTDGQQRNVGVPFDVDSYQLNYPGEPIGPPAIWIRCRCVLRVVAGGVTAAVALPEDKEEPVAQEKKKPTDPADLGPIPWNGVLAIEGGMSGDYRTLVENEVTWRGLPVPLRWAKEDNGGHDGAVIVGRIDRIWRDGNLLRGEGVFDTSEEADEVVRLLAEKFVRGVSVDMDNVEVYADENPDSPEKEMVGRISAATLVAIPAFQEAYVALGPYEGDVVQDGDAVQDEPVTASGEFAISEKPWDGDSSRFTLEQWCESTIISLEDGCESKNDHKLPILEPGGALSRAGVYAAAARINQTEAPTDKISAAKAKLRSAYKKLGEDAPEVIQASLETEQFVEIPSDVGVPGERGRGWITNTEDTSRLPSTGTLYAWNAQSKDAKGYTRPEATAVCTTCGGSGTVTFVRQSGTQAWTTTSQDQTVTSVGNGTGTSTTTGTDGSSLEGSHTWRIGWFTNDESARSLMDYNSTTYAATNHVSTLHTLNRLRNKKTGIEASVVTARCAACAATGYTTSQTPTTGTSTPMDHEHASNASGPTTGVQSSAEGAQEFVPADVGIPGERGSGWLTNPSDTIRLHRYWTDPGQPGYAKIGWGTPNDFYRCRRELAKYVEPQYLNATCAEWHHDALGVWPGQHSLNSEAAMVAAATFDMEKPKAAWFADQNLPGPTALTVTDEGQVYGHIAEWGTCHIGIRGECVSPPMSANDYAYFHTGIIDTDEGEVQVGTLSMGGGHAGLSENYSSTVAHYDSTSTAAAYVHVGEDKYGIWMAGMVSPSMGDADTFALRAAGSVSGDWRSIGGGEPDLVAVLAVNVAGFAMPRMAIAASASSVNAMVALNPVQASRDDREVVALARRESKAHSKLMKLRAGRAYRKLKTGEK